MSYKSKLVLQIFVSISCVCYLCSLRKFKLSFLFPSLHARCIEDSSCKSHWIFSCSYTILNDIGHEVDSLVSCLLAYVGFVCNLASVPCDVHIFLYREQLKANAAT